MAGFKEGALQLKERDLLLPSDVGTIKLLADTTGKLYTVNEFGVSARIGGDVSGSTYWNDILDKQYADNYTDGIISSATFIKINSKLDSVWKILKTNESLPITPDVGMIGINHRYALNSNIKTSGNGCDVAYWNVTTSGGITSGYWSFENKTFGSCIVNLDTNNIDSHISAVNTNWSGSPLNYPVGIYECVSATNGTYYWNPVVINKYPTPDASKNYFLVVDPSTSAYTWSNSISAIYASSAIITNLSGTSIHYTSGSFDNVTIKSFGGTSAQFVKGDGSLDSTKYWTSAYHPTTLSAYGISTEDTLFDPIYLNNSVGVIDSNAPSFLDNNNGTCTIGSCNVNLRDNTTLYGRIKTYNVSSKTFTIPADGNTYFIEINYNSGNPTYQLTSNAADINDSTIVAIYSCWRVTTSIGYAYFGSNGTLLSNKINYMIDDTKPYSVSNGSSLRVSEVNRLWSITSATIYSGTTRVNAPSIIASNTNMYACYHSSGSWMYTSGSSLYDNLNYDDGTNLQTLGNNKWSVRWIYRAIGKPDRIFYTLGSTSYNTSASADLEQPRTDLPKVIIDHCILVGKSIIQYNAASGITRYVISTAFSSSSVTNHNDLNGILGDTPYYHLGLSEYNLINNIEALSGSSGLLKLTSGTPSLDTNSYAIARGTSAQFLKGDGSLDSSHYLTSNQNIILSGDATGTGSSAINVTLANVNSTSGLFGSSTNIPTIVVNNKGLITSATNTPINIVHTQISDWTLATSKYLSANQTITLSGDATGSGTSAINVVLSTINNTPGTYGSTSATPTFLVNGKGLVTSAGLLPIIISHTQVNDWNSATSQYLSANQVIILSGDVSGSGTSGIGVTLANVNNTPGSIGCTSGSTIITTNSKGLVTSAAIVPIQIVENQVTGLITDLSSKMTASNYPDLGAIEALSGTSGLLRKTGTNIWTLDTTSYLSGNQIITISGDATGSGTSAIGLTLATVNNTTGTFGNSSSIPVLIVNNKGLITSASNQLVSITHGQISDWNTVTSHYLSANQNITVTGDVSGSGTSAINLSLPNIITAGTVGSGSIVPVITYDQKGRLTSVTSAAIQISESQVTGLKTDLASKMTTSNYPDLVAIEALTGTYGSLKKTAANTWALDTTSYLSANPIITLSGDATGSGTSKIGVVLANVNNTSGTFGTISTVPRIVVNNKGLITSASSISIQISESQVNNLTSDLNSKLNTVTAANTYLTISNPTFSGVLAGPQLSATHISASSLYDSQLTNTNVLISSGGTIIDSQISNDVLMYLNGTSANIQNQFNRLTGDFSDVDDQFLPMWSSAVNGYVNSTAATVGADKGVIVATNTYANAANDEHGPGIGVQIVIPLSGGTNTARGFRFNTGLNNELRLWQGTWGNPISWVKTFEVTSGGELVLPLTMSGEKILASNSNHGISETTIPSTYLNGLSANIQDQINNNSGIVNSALSNYLPLSGGYNNKLTGDLFTKSITMLSGCFYINNTGTDNNSAYIKYNSDSNFQINSDYSRSILFTFEGSTTPTFAIGSGSITANADITTKSIYPTLGTGCAIGSSTNQYADIFVTQIGSPSAYVTDAYLGNIHGNSISTYSISTSSVVISGGTSSQFLKADGSLDSTSYWSSSNHPTALSAYGITSADTLFNSKYLGISASILHSQISDWETYINQPLLTTSSPTFAYITGVGDIFASKYMGYGTAGYGYKIGTNTGTLYSSDIGQPWAFWVRPYKYTGTNCQMRLGVSTRTTSGSSDIDAISIDGDGATSFIQMIYANGGISGNLTGHASLDLPLTGGTMTAGAKILTLQDMTINTGANTNYSNAPFVAQRNTIDGTTTHASIGFHNRGVNAAALFYHAGNSNFWFNDDIGGLYQLWSSKDFSQGWITNWVTAYNWGNHASAGYLLSSTASSTYQPLENQRLSTSNSPTFGQLHIGGVDNPLIRLVSDGSINVRAIAGHEFVVATPTDPYSSDGLSLRFSGSEGNPVAIKAGAFYASGFYEGGVALSSKYLQANQSISLTGAVTGSGTTSIATSFANTHLAGIDQNLTTTSSPTFTAMYTNSAFGTCGIVTGNADSAAYTAYNLKIKSWYGIGFESYDGVTRIIMDTRTGGIATLGAISVGGLITANGGIGANILTLTGNNSIYLTNGTRTFAQLSASAFNLTTQLFTNGYGIHTDHLTVDASITAGSVQCNGSFRTKYTELSSNYTASNNDCGTIFAVTSTGITLTFATGGDYTNGFNVQVFGAGGGTYASTISIADGFKLNGTIYAPGKTISMQNNIVQIWYVNGMWIAIRT